MKTTLFVCIALICFAVPVSLFAQTAEISPYAGYIWPGSFGGIGDFQNNQLLGVRGGFYVTPRFEIGGNWNWNNHFLPTSTNLARELGFPQSPTRANVLEAEFTYNFTGHSLFGSKAKPYVVVGAGGLRASVTNGNTSVLSVRPNVLFAANDVLNSGDTFFTISYGGGFKMQRLWGPMGLFGDFRGRTLTSFFGSSETWPEVSAGLNFAWGER
jgi:hypothetical protein